ncbi:Protein of unknown function DUF1685 [Cynara cardunculus var. scolymus]|uniref:Uncharacterized protein n=1 Tax=Cynara cardunculus var. scolymus TaxID=59895 RepID=A0A118K016_CYNCS|nr:Protein of unknown function DUF1685 [Cynara cardunculus var. scolymus]
MTSSATSSPYESEIEELEQSLEDTPMFWSTPKKILSKQLSMLETQRDLAWEKKRHQMLMQERRREAAIIASSELCDEDLKELKGCIELGFGFNEDKGGQSLTNTFPALDLYFAVNRLGSPTSPSSSSSSGSRFSPIRSLSSRSLEGSPSSVCREDPQQVKTKLRHWAQAVACSVMQSS